MVFKRYLEETDKSVIISGMLDYLKEAAKRLRVNLNKISVGNFRIDMDDVRVDYRSAIDQRLPNQYQYNK